MIWLFFVTCCLAWVVKSFDSGITLIASYVSELNSNDDWYANSLFISFSTDSIVPDAIR